MCVDVAVVSFSELTSHKAQTRGRVKQFPPVSEQYVLLGRIRIDFTRELSKVGFGIIGSAGRVREI